MTLFLASLLLGSGFAAIHLLSPALRVPDGVPRNRLLSAAGGLAVAFIFLRILPEFGGSQQVFGATPRGTLLGLPGHHVSVIAFVSLALCSAVGRLVQTSRAQQRAAIGHHAPGERVFWMHLPTDALDNFVIASLLTHRADTRGWLSLGRFFVALALKVVADDHSLHAVHQANSDRRGRWLLALAALAGWDLRQLTDLSELASATLEAFPAGEAVLSVLKEERPAQQQARLSAFALGTFGSGALLLALAAG